MRRLSRMLGLAVLAGCSRDLPVAPNLARSGTTSDVVETFLPFQRGYDIDAAGRIAGSNAGDQIALVWTPAEPRGTTGVVTLLEESRWSAAYALNGSGHVGGYVGADAALWGDGTMATLPRPSADSGLRVRGLSTPAAPGGSFFAVGEQWPPRGVVWWLSGGGGGASLTTSAIDLLPGSGRALAVNASGVVVGEGPTRWTTTGPGQWAATPLGLLSGHSLGVAEAINAAGTSVGRSIASGAECGRAVLWPSGSTTPVALPLLKGFACSWAHDINDAGQIAGSVRNSTTKQDAAVVWLPGSGGSYSVKQVSKDKNQAWAVALNEPAVESGALWVELIGSGQPGSWGSVAAVLWKVRLSP